MTSWSPASRKALLSTVLAAAIVQLPAAARADELDSILTELAQANEELVVFVRSAKPKAEANLALKAKHVAELDVIKAESVKIESAGASIEADRPAVDAACTGTYQTESALAAAKARCHAVLTPFNARVDLNKRHWTEVKQRYDQLTRLENARVKEGQELQQKGEQLTKRVESLKRSAMVAAQTRCLRGLAEKLSDPAAPPESLSHEQSICFDQANRQIAVAIGQSPPMPSSSASPNRTAEQAIKEYRESGREKPRQPIQKTEPPPPPK